MREGSIAAFRTTVFALGNSHAVRIPKRLLESLAYKENESVELSVGEEGSIIMKKLTPATYRSLKDRFTGYTGDYQPGEWDTGKPVGKEVL